MRIIVTGLIGSIPMAGLTFHYLQYVLGLRELGHEVLYLEDTGVHYYEPETDTMTDDPSGSLHYLSATMRSFDLGSDWAFVDISGGLHGAVPAKMRDFIQSAELFFNITGAGLIREEYIQIPRRVYVDTDPGFVQMRIASGSEKDQKHLASHTDHFSFGANIGHSDCKIPKCDFDWKPTTQPVVMGLWPCDSGSAPQGHYTTILKWKTYRPVRYRERVYGLKDMEFARFLDLPSRSRLPFEIAMTGSPPWENLEELGWILRDARPLSRSLSSYADFIRGSRGEWSVAKNAYVASSSGWFSDRSASYLASGRPVLLQSTGFERWLDAGRGLLSFATVDEAVDALAAIEGDYQAHCRAARELAQNHFAAGTVLGKLLAELGA